MSTHLAELLPSGFTLTDALDPSLAEQLASASQTLERTLPLEDPNPTPATRERAARARAERQKQLGAALEAALPLLEPSRYDIQVLAVLQRLLVETEGLDGCREVLSVVARMLHEGWAGLSASLAGRTPREQDKLRRKWARYLDAVFEQMHTWLAHARERDERALAAQVSSAAAGWVAALEDVERGLAATEAAVGRFDAIDRTLRALGREHDAPSPAPVGDPTAPGHDEEVATDGPRDGADGGTALRDAIVHDAAGTESTGDDSTPAPSALLRVSARFWELSRRLAAFEALLARGEYEKAGIVEADLREQLDHFDVAAYFPGLFAPYFERCAEHGAQLAEHHPERGALRSSALASLYRTDLERFLDLPEPSAGAYARGR